MVQNKQEIGYSEESKQYRVQTTESEVKREKKEKKRLGSI